MKKSGVGLEGVGCSDQGWRSGGVTSDVLNEKETKIVMHTLIKEGERGPRPAAQDPEPMKQQQRLKYLLAVT